MKRTTGYIVLALAAVLAMGLMAGCSSQPAASSSTGGASFSAEGQSQDELTAELKDAIANAPAYKSVTITVDEETVATNDPEPLKSSTVYKFDASGDKLKTSAAAEMGNIVLQYYSDGDDAVCVTDVDVYSGTTSQFDEPFFAGAEAYMKSTIGDLNTLVDCAATVEKMETNGLVSYAMTLDPEKYIASDEILTTLSESGSPVTEASLTITFDEDGSIGAIDKKDTFEDSTITRTLVFSDYDSTVIDPMPEATKTFEEMNADMQAKLDAFAAQVDSEESASK